MSAKWIDRLDRAVAGAIALGRWLVLPVSLLLFMQWPLRDLVQAYSIQANDLAQWLFALYVSLALTDATRARAHLAADAFAQRYGAAARRRIGRAAALLCLVPWSLFVLVAGAPMVWRSIGELEAFPETYTSGYFIIKTSAWLLALLVLAQALLDIARRSEAR
jgi:TRAP-type mannitol/chloroaromatic compound transport system permease small subunit